MDIKAGRYTANYPDEFVVFFIGMRINYLWRLKEWWPVLWAALAMTKELKRLPNTPLLESRTVWTLSDLRVPLFIQYWRSFDELEAWANDKGFKHMPARKAFFRRTGNNGHVGVWHETFRVRAGEYEAIYANTPPMYMGSFAQFRSLRPASTFRDRLGDPNAS
jgi:Domain of unknown function (DUF4188)